MLWDCILHSKKNLESHRILTDTTSVDNILISFFVFPFLLYLCFWLLFNSIYSQKSLWLWNYLIACEHELMYFNDAYVLGPFFVRFKIDSLPLNMIFMHLCSFNRFMYTLHSEHYYFIVVMDSCDSMQKSKLLQSPKNILLINSFMNLILIFEW